jgi:hypothetical protein
VRLARTHLVCDNGAAGNDFRTPGTRCTGSYHRLALGRAANADTKHVRVQHESEDMTRKIEKKPTREFCNQGL